MLKVQSIKREFIYDNKTLPDPDPTATPYQVIEFYSNQYPEFISAAIQRSKISTEELLIYEIKTKMGTNG